MPYRFLRLIAVLFLLLPGTLLAQQPPYDIVPEAEPPYYRVRYEASEKPGELDLPVKYTLWIPPQVKTLRGIVVHQHGCGEGSCKSGLTGAFDLHWQALAAKHDCALLAASYEQPQEADCGRWCDPRNGSDARFQQSLVDLGELSQHPELATVPWALWGHSGGGTWSGIMTLLHPDRVAAAWLRSGVPPMTHRPDRPNRLPIAPPSTALDTPIMLNLGTGEGVTVKEGRFSTLWPRVQEFFKTLRAKDCLVGVAVDPLTQHECGNQRYLAIPWFDTCLTHRLPAVAGNPMSKMPPADAWLAPLAAADGVSSARPTSAGPNRSSNKIELSSAANYAGDPHSAIWLPNESIAVAWKQYVTDTKVADNSPPPAPKNLQITNGVLTWTATADLQSGIAYFIIQCDGQRLATVPETPKNRFGRPLFQGLQYSDTPLQPLVKMEFALPNWNQAQTHHYDVISVNTVGLESK